MANEATLTVGLRIYKTSSDLVILDFNQQASYQEDVNGTFGPTPGTVVVPTSGVAVSFTGISRPGFCWLHNHSPDYYVQIGPRDPDSQLFYPLLELLPGMRYPIYLARDVFEEYTGIGTGTGTGSPTNQLWMKAFGGTANVYCGGFES